MSNTRDSELSPTQLSCSSGSGMTNGNVIPKGNKGLVIATLNINSLIKHIIDEVRIFLAQHALDILAIDESKLDNLISDNEICVTGYTVYRKDRNRFGGWVVIYIRDNLLHSQRNDLTTDDFEMACIEVKLPYNKSFLVATWYRPPSSKIDLFDKWALFLSKCDIENKELIIVGDLNCDVSNPLPNSHAHRLKFLCSLYQLKQFINEPTRVTSTSATIIDLILTNTPENILQSGVIHLGISDHSLVYALRKFSLPKSYPKYKIVRNFKNFNENQFILDVSLIPWELVYQHIDPNLCWQVWKDLFLQALDRHAPIQSRRLRSNPIPWITPEIKKLMQVRDWHKKRAIKHNSSAHWALYKKLRNKVNTELCSQKSNYFIGKIKERSQSNDVKGSWSLINSLLGRNKNKTNITELIVDNVSIFDDRSIAESMNEYFISIGTILADEIDSNSDYQDDDLTYTN